ncbi:MAG: HAMP domain-containing protein, partial [Lachnospiraceae bacterium]|nr:HAMP domain-containing protein [Lachnospiraceae bacterium]
MSRLGLKAFEEKFGNQHIGVIIRRWLFAVMLASILVSMLGVLLVQRIYRNIYSFKLVTDNVKDVDSYIDAMFEQDVHSALEEYTPYLVENYNNGFVDSKWLAKGVAINSESFSEINIVDERGIVVVSSNPDYIGYDMHDGEQSAEFLCLLSGTDFYIQELRENSVHAGEKMLYYGSAINDGSGFVEYGMTEETYIASLYDAMERAAESRRIGLKGFIATCDKDLHVICSTNGILDGQDFAYTKLLPAEDEVLCTDFIKIGKKEYYAAAQKYLDYWIIGGYSVAEAEFGDHINTVLVVLMNIIVSLLVFKTLSQLMSRHVVEGIEEVNASLAKISDGDLEETVEIGTSLEFKELSSGINGMVDKL